MTNQISCTKSSTDITNWQPNKVQLSILHAANFVCECCGLQSRSHAICPSGFMHLQSVAGKNVVLCSVCAASQALNSSVNSVHNHGKVVYAPDISQGHVSRLSLAALVTRASSSEVAAKATELWQYLSVHLPNQSQDIFPDLASGEIENFIAIQQQLGALEPAAVEQLKNAFRYIPNPEAYANQLRYWGKACPSLKLRD